MEQNTSTVIRDGIDAAEKVLNGTNEVLNGKNPMAFLFVFTFSVFSIILAFFVLIFGYFQYQDLVDRKEEAIRMETNNQLLKQISDNMKNISEELIHCNQKNLNKKF